jgi:hemoglobin-like flavoprotein
MSPHQIDLVQRSWSQVVPIADTAAQMFYERLFILDPSLRHLFRGEMKEQGRKLISMISFAVNGLSRLEQLVPGVQALGRRHGGYGVRDEHYGTVGAALLWTLEQGLGDSFTPSVREAWTAVYGVLANTMKHAAKLAARPVSAVV